jgi:predicted MFS family arabinose efflux permease
VKRVFHLPAYRRLLAAYTLNELAWSFGTLALAVLVYRRTGSATGTAAFFLCSQFVPALVSPVVVARLDQRNPRSVLAFLYALEGVAFGVLAWLAHRFSLAPVLVFVFFDGVLAVTARALARATTVSVLTPVGLLREGNAVTNAGFSLCLMAGPAIGGAVVAVGGTIAALLANCGLFAAVAVVLASAALPPAPAERVPSTGRLRAALREARRSVPIRNLLGVQVAGLVFFTISIPVTVVLAQHTLHAGAGGYGVLLSVWGAGAVAGSIVFARWRKRPMRTLIVLSAGALGAGYIVMASAPTLAVACAGAAFAGLGNGLELTAARTALQEVVEEAWMGMMMSLSESANQATPGVGIVLGGVITALASPRTAFAVAGAGALAIVPIAIFALRPTLPERLRRGQVA